MLQRIRDGLHGRKWLAWVALAPIALIFVFWGGSNSLDFTGVSKQDAVEVDGHKVPAIKATKMWAVAQKQWAQRIGTEIPPEQQKRLQDGDREEALDAALAVGDFDTSNPSHHGTPEQRADAWNSGFESGDPSSCSSYLDPANLGDGSGAAQTDAPQEQDPSYPGDVTGYGLRQQQAAYEHRGVAAVRG